MGKSFKRNAVEGNTKAGSDSDWKRSDRQAARRIVKQATEIASLLTEDELDRIDESEILVKEHVRDVWNSPKDGKHRITRWDDETEEEYNSRLRRAKRK